MDHLVSIQTHNLVQLCFHTWKLLLSIRKNPVQEPLSYHFAIFDLFQNDNLIFLRQFKTLSSIDQAQLYYPWTKIDSFRKV